MVEKSYSLCADSDNIRIPRSPNLWGKDINLPLMSEQFFPPVITGKKFVLMTLSNYLSLNFDVQYSPHEVYSFMLESSNESRVRCLRFIPRYLTQHTQLFYPLAYFLLIVFCLNVSDRVTVPRWCWPSAVIFMFVPLKADLDFCITLSLIINHDLLPSLT